MHGLIDIGVNLAHDSFDHDREDVIARGAAAGVVRLIVTGSTTLSSRLAIDIARRHPGKLFATCGVHPHHAAEFGPETGPELVELSTHPEVVAIGECGLDYFRDFSPRADQRRAFEKQLGLAVTLGKPLFLHQRDAHADFLAMIREASDELPGGVAHCFTGDRSQMESYLDLGLYIGVTGWICDDRRGHALRAAVAGLPMERVLLETDAPYLVPRTLAAKPATRRNEPAYLPIVLEMAALCMKVDALALAKASTENAERLFRLPRYPST